jgi:hypothetical protein
VTLAEGLESYGCGHKVGQYGGRAVWGYAEGLESYGCGNKVGQYGVMLKALSPMGVVIRLGSMGLRDFGRRLRVLWVW